MIFLLAILSLCHVADRTFCFGADLAPEPGLYRVSVQDADGQWHRGEFRIEAGRSEYTVVVEPVAVTDEGGAWPWIGYAGSPYEARAGQGCVKWFDPDAGLAAHWWDGP